MDRSESALGYIYRRIYDGICGHHPNLRPWHFQWLGVFYLYRQLQRILPEMGGKVLDVGCGGKPYRSWFGQVSEYIGLDVSPGPAVDVLVALGARVSYHARNRSWEASADLSAMLRGRRKQSRYIAQPWDSTWRLCAKALKPMATNHSAHTTV